VALGCQEKQPPSSFNSVTNRNTKTYCLRGVIVSVDSSKGEATIDHQAVPGFMDAMIMPYKFKDPSVLSDLHPGDHITADILVNSTPDADVLLDNIVVVAQARPDYKPAVFYHVPEKGDQVPDFHLVNQGGRQIHLGQFRGKALLVTFIYTRCPMADFCPRVSRNFAAIDKSLASDPALYGKTHLVSISFDPEYDTPKVLRSYGAAYTGKYTKETFEHWDFAAPSRANLTEVARFFDLGITPEKNNTITHTLSTTLIGPDGNVYRFYPGNDWTTEQVLADVKQVLSGHV
jgi:protein SCO1